VNALTRNVNSDHLQEIFGKFGTIKSVDLLFDKRRNISEGKAYISFETKPDALKAIEYMNGVRPVASTIYVIVLRSLVLTSAF